MKKLNQILSTIASTKIAILILVVMLLATLPSVIAQFTPPPGIGGIVSVDGVPAPGLTVRIENLNTGEFQEQTTAYDTPNTTSGGYAVAMDAKDGHIIEISVFYNEVTYYNTTIVDLSLFSQWLNLSINTGNPPSEHTICAYVADADTSVAISGATVTCNGESEDTDADGMAYFTVFPNIYTVTATKTDYQSDSTTVTVCFNDVFTTLYLTKINNDPPDDPPVDPPPDNPPPDDPPVPPDDPPLEEHEHDEQNETETIYYNLTVSVFDDITSFPINNASVIIYDPELNDVSRNNTNESGMITFQLEEGDYVVVAEKDDYTIKRGAVNLLTSMEYEMLMGGEGLDGSGDFIAQQNIQEQDSSIMYVGVGCIIAIIVVAVLLIEWKGWIWKRKKVQ